MREVRPRAISTVTIRDASASRQTPWTALHPSPIKNTSARALPRRHQGSVAYYRAELSFLLEVAAMVIDVSFFTIRVSCQSPSM